MSRRSAWRGDPRQDRDGAAARPLAAARTSLVDDRHPGRRAAVLRLGQRPADGRPAGRSTSSCPGALALAVIATSLVNLGIATAYERNYGVLKRLGGSPLTRGGLLAAKMRRRPPRRDRARSCCSSRSRRSPRLAAGPGASSAALRRRASCSGRSPSPASACSWRARSGPRRPSRSPTACSSRSCCSAGSSCPSRTCPEPLAAIAGVLPAAALADAFRVALGAGRRRTLAALAGDPRGLGRRRRRARAADVPLGVGRTPRPPLLRRRPAGPAAAGPASRPSTARRATAAIVTRTAPRGRRSPSPSKPPRSAPIGRTP